MLENPKTDNYWRFKELVLSADFPWYYYPFSTPHTPTPKGRADLPFYSHIFMTRATPPLGYSEYRSPHFTLAAEVLKEICIHNGIDLLSFLRMNANCSQLASVPSTTVSHYDHRFRHKNLLLYLTDAGGETIVEGERHSPKMDEAIAFEGKHYFELPANPTNSPMSQRRVVIVATFLDPTVIEMYKDYEYK
ncbi:MAG: hypothetical protein EB127_00655 [Alphaproteobacteria bacterium]|nr:hypothetical protein [Alphaproteobacteria bacterium]